MNQRHDTMRGASKGQEGWMERREGGSERGEGEEKGAQPRDKKSGVQGS